ncbi:hypothetical protein CGRA01v4_00659 [Colletotrichum graminicola]|nr:hypothetical protein CGRA01v4_00659 [Colletotrichum graminicola]
MLDLCPAFFFDLDWGRCHWPRISGGIGKTCLAPEACRYLARAHTKSRELVAFVVQISSAGSSSFLG